MLFGVGILCYVSWSIVSYLLYAVANLLPRLGKRELVFLLLFTCNFVVSVRRRFYLPFCTWDGLRYFIVALPGPSINCFGLYR